ncbi:unnamed protein product [Prorocentrum cordatum]|uniref:Catechol O-methyltransferase n=1 Tax=Prorocentrum cordatum TaxID=2364126 RepID=A0ABN9RZ15_9DINO|nr:unnamed protein product [Polarella glacialis]
MRGVKAVNPLNLANLAWAWASAGHHGEMSTRRMGLRDHEFFEWIAGAAVQCSQAFTPQNCSNLVWGFATLRIGNTALFEHMSDQVTAWLERDFDPQHLSNVLWSYAKLALRDPKSCALFEAAAAEVVRRGVGYLSRSTQNISNTVWAYGALQVGPPAFLHAVSEYLQGGDFYAQLTRTRPLPKSSRAQLAMTVQSLHRLGLTGVAWHLFDRLAADELQASGEAYSNWLFICGDTGDSSREVAVWEHMARVGHTRGVQAAVWNCAVLRSLALGDTRRAALALQAIDAAGLSTPMSEHLRQRAGAPAPRGAVGEVEWRRREKEEHEWVTNPLGFSLRLNKVEYPEIGTLHYILKHGERLNLPSIHRSIESFTQEQELWLKLAGDEKGAVLDAVIAMHGRPMLVVEVGLYVGYSSTRMASQLRAWGGRIISMEVDPYHAAIWGAIRGT